MKMLEQRIGRLRDATRALTQVPTGWGRFGCPTTHTVGQKALTPRGMGTASPFQKSSLPDFKKMLTKGGESWASRADQGSAPPSDAPTGRASARSVKLLRFIVSILSYLMRR